MTANEEEERPPPTKRIEPSSWVSGQVLIDQLRAYVVDAPHHSWSRRWMGIAADELDGLFDLVTSLTHRAQALEGLVDAIVEITGNTDRVDAIDAIKAKFKEPPKFLGFKAKEKWELELEEQIVLYHPMPSNEKLIGGCVDAKSRFFFKTARRDGWWQYTFVRSDARSDGMDAVMIYEGSTPIMVVKVENPDDE